MTRMLPATTDLPASLAALLPDVPTREDIDAVADHLLALEAAAGVVADPDTRHHHADALYGRSVSIPAGMLVVGLPHRQGALTVIVGDVTVWSEGRPRLRHTGTTILATGRGERRAAFAHTDTAWLTVQANLTGTTDLDVIERALCERPKELLTARRAALEVTA